MSRLAAGHDRALNDLMERHAPKLFNYLIRCLRNEDDAADTAQETFVRVYQNRAKFDLRQKFSTWLYTIATNLVKDRYRWRSRHPQVSLDAENEATEIGFHETMPSMPMRAGATLRKGAPGVFSGSARPSMGGEWIGTVTAPGKSGQANETLKFEIKQ